MICQWCGHKVDQLMESGALDVCPDCHKEREVMRAMEGKDQNGMDIHTSVCSSDSCGCGNTNEGDKLINQCDRCGHIMAYKFGDFYLCGACREDLCIESESLILAGG